MKIEDKKEIYVGIIKACFLILCGVCSYYYVNYDTIKAYSDWRSNLLEPIIIGTSSLLLLFGTVLIRALRRNKWFYILLRVFYFSSAYGLHTLLTILRLVLKITKVIRQYHAKLIRLLYQKIRIILNRFLTWILIFACHFIIFVYILTYPRS